MTLTVVGASTSLGRYGNGAGSMPLVGTRDGSLHVADYILTAAMEGRVFHAGVGSLTTPTTFRVGITTLQPEAVIDVPTGTTIIPVWILVHLEDGAGTDTEAVAMTGTALRGAGTSTAGTPLSTRTDRGVSTGCSFYYTYSANGTAMSGTVEFWRHGYAFADATTNPAPHWVYDVRSIGTPQVIVGPGSLSLYVGATGTAPAGYIEIDWIELPSTGI